MIAYIKNLIENIITKFNQYMDNRDNLDRLALVKFQTWIMIIISITFLAFEILIIGIIIFSFAMYWNIKQYRCPHCSKTLDSRMKLDDHTHCPHCGKVISVSKKPLK